MRLDVLLPHEQQRYRRIAQDPLDIGAAQSQGLVQDIHDSISVDCGEACCHRHPLGRDDDDFSARFQDMLADIVEHVVHERIVIVIDDFDMAAGRVEAASDVAIGIDEQRRNATRRGRFGNLHHIFLRRASRLGG